MYVIWINLNIPTRIATNHNQFVGSSPVLEWLEKHLPKFIGKTFPRRIRDHLCFVCHLFFVLKSESLQSLVGFVFVWVCELFPLITDILLAFVLNKLFANIICGLFFSFCLLQALLILLVEDFSQLHWNYSQLLYSLYFILSHFEVGIESFFFLKI